MQRRGRQQSIFELQENLTPTMRMVLLDWMSQVAHDYRQKRQTFHLAVEMTDIYFERCPH